MPDATLMLDGVIGLATATAFGVTGRALAKRPVEGERRLAARAFVAWWGSAALVTGILAAMRLLAGLDALTPALVETLVFVILLPTAAGLGCLVYYLGFVATGWARLHVPVAAGYAVLYAVLVGYVASCDPVGFRAAPWSLHIEYASAPAGWPFLAVVALIFAPPLLAVLAYVRLYRHVESATQRYRIALVSAGVVVLLASGVVASEVGLPRFHELYPASRTAALVGSLGILLAYVPPTWVRRRLRVEAVHEEGQGAA